MFTIEQIVADVTLIQSGSLNPQDSTVYKAWQDFAETMRKWCDNLTNFEDRSIEQIVADFASNEMIKEDDEQ